MPQRFNNGGEETQLIRGGSHMLPPPKKIWKINDYEYVYLFVTHCADYGQAHAGAGGWMVVHQPRPVVPLITVR